MPDLKLAWGELRDVLDGYQHEISVLEQITGKQPDGVSYFSRSDPEEGNRLMGAFWSIRQRALRQAIVKSVTELSALDER